MAVSVLYMSIMFSSGRMHVGMNQAQKRPKENPRKVNTVAVIVMMARDVEGSANITYSPRDRWRAFPGDVDSHLIGYTRWPHTKTKQTLILVIRQTLQGKKKR
jgi:hypothetical protein